MERADVLLENYFPMRPGLNGTSGQRINLATNYFKFSFTNNSVKCFFKYAVDFQPDVPGDSKDLRRKLWKSAAPFIREKLNHTIFNNTTCFSQENCCDPIEVPVCIDGSDYVVYVKWANQILNNSLEALSLYKKFFGQIVRKLRYIPIRRNYFDPKNSHKVENLEVWPGFNSAINIFPDGILLNINVIHKVLRPDTALGQINKLFSRGNNQDLKSEIQEMFKGCVVLTRYNNDKTYIIDSVDFNMNPMSTFMLKDKEVTFIQYYQEKYQKMITEKNQPLLVSLDKKTNSNIYLIPEFCFLTGLTDEMRSNFNLMKSLAVITKGTAQSKMSECVNLINTFLNKEDCRNDVKTWGITIAPEPVKLEGRKLDAGNIVMHRTSPKDRFNFSIDNTEDIDRKIQVEMYSQPEISRWIIFSTGKDQGLVQTMMDTLKQVKGSFKYQLQEPKMITVQSPMYKDWERAIENTLKSCGGAQLVFLVLPGSKGKGTIYNDVKRLLTVRYPVPSQVVLSGTLAKPKGLRSVINKVLMQICAKVGGEPWAVDRMPFSNIPTMIVGIDVHNKGNKSFLGCVGTYNNTFTKYHSICKHDAKMADLSEKVAEGINELHDKFAEINRIAPHHILVFRDGLAPTQVKSVQNEIRLVKSRLPNTKLTYIVLNKKNTLKVFNVTGNPQAPSYNNIPPGTLVDNTVVNSENFDFFLISQKTNQGLSQATHYHIVYDDYKVSPQDIHEFVYKNCYLYYNWTGGIKIPAPCQYAKKLAFLVGDKLSSNQEVFLPENRFIKEIRSLYFL